MIAPPPAALPAPHIEQRESARRPWHERYDEIMLRLRSVDAQIDAAAAARGELLAAAAALRSR